MAAEEIPQIRIIFSFALYWLFHKPFGLRSVTQTFQRFMDDHIEASSSCTYVLITAWLKVCTKNLTPNTWTFVLMIPLHQNRMLAILDYPRQTTVRQLRMFDGLVSFYRWSMLNHVPVMWHLRDQLRGNAKIINLDDNSRKAVSTAKERMTKATMLTPQDLKVPIGIAVDASASAFRGVLQLWVNDSWKILALFSKQF